MGSSLLQHARAAQDILIEEPYPPQGLAWPQFCLSMFLPFPIDTSVSSLNKAVPSSCSASSSFLRETPLGIPQEEIRSAWPTPDSTVITDI